MAPSGEAWCDEFAWFAVGIGDAMVTESGRRTAQEYDERKSSRRSCATMSADVPKSNLRSSTPEWQATGARRFRLEERQRPSSIVSWMTARVQ